MLKFPRIFEELVGWLAGNVKQPSDWHALVALAGETLTIGTLAEAVLAPDVDLAIPPEINDLLVDIRKRAQARNQMLLGQFHELLPALNESGVRPIVMKGLARLLGDPEAEKARILSDLDLLVPAGKRNDCVRAFTDLGYSVVEGAEDGLPPVLARSCDAGTVDLHTRLKPAGLGLDYEAIASQCQQVELEKGVFLLPSVTCQLLLEVIHDQLHDRDYWRGLVDVRHLVDVHRLVRAGVDWPTLASFFQAGPPRRAFQLQMLTARSLLNVDIPEEFRAGAWVRLQLFRRRVQAHFPRSRALFTLLTIAADPPRRSRSADPAPYRAMPLGRKLGECVERYILRSQPGKL